MKTFHFFFSVSITVEWRLSAVWPGTINLLGSPYRPPLGHGSVARSTIHIGRRQYDALRKVVVNMWITILSLSNGFCNTYLLAFFPTVTTVHVLISFHIYAWYAGTLSSSLPASMLVVTIGGKNSKKKITPALWTKETAITSTGTCRPFWLIRSYMYRIYRCIWLWYEIYQ